MKKVLCILLALTSSAFGQAYTQMQWGMNKTVSPYAFGVNLSGTWTNLGTVTPGGVWSLTPDSVVTNTLTANTANISALMSNNVPISVTNYPGVDPSGATFSDSGFALWIAAMKAQNRRGWIPKGNYKFQNQLVFDVAGWTPGAFNVECEGYYAATLDVTAVTTSPQMLFTMSGGSPAAPVDQFYATIKQCLVSADTKNVTSGVGRIAVSIGTPTYADALNGDYFDLVVSNNDNINANAVSVQLNWLIESEFKLVASGGGYKHITSAGKVSVINGTTGVTGTGTDFVTAGVTTGDFIAIDGVWYGVASVASNTSLTLDSNYLGVTGGDKDVLTRGSLEGTALRLDRVALSTFFRGAFGQSDKSIYITAGNSFGNVFLNPDLEEVNYPLVIDSASAARNTFIGGTFAYNKAGVNATNGFDSLLLSANIGPKYNQPVNDFASQVGVTYVNGNKITPAGGSLTQLGAGTQQRNLTSGTKSFQDAIDVAGTTYHTNYTNGVYDNYIVQPLSCFGYYVGATLIQSGCGAGFTYTIPAAFNAGLSVGVAGSTVGSIAFNNATSGTISLRPTTGALGAAVATLPANTGTIAELNLAQSFTALQTFGAGWGVASMAVSATAPTIGSGFGTSPAIVASNGTAAFQVNVGTGGAANTGTITMPAAANGWSCSAVDVTTPAGNLTRQTGSTTTSVSVSNYNAAGTLTPWTASDRLNLMCAAF